MRGPSSLRGSSESRMEECISRGKSNWRVALGITRAKECTVGFTMNLHHLREGYNYKSKYLYSRKGGNFGTTAKRLQKRGRRELGDCQRYYYIMIAASRVVFLIKCL